MATNPDINLSLNLKRFTAASALTATRADGSQLVSLDDNGLAFVTGGDVGTALGGLGIPKAAFQLAASSLQAGIVPQTLTMAYASMHLTAGMTVDLNYNFASADANYNDFAFAVLVDANDYTQFQPLLLADQKHFQQQYGGLTGTYDKLYSLFQGYHAGQHLTVDHTGDYRLVVGVADVSDKTGVSELKLLDVSLGLAGGSYTVKSNFNSTAREGLQLSDGTLLDIDGSERKADGTAAFGQMLGGNVQADAAPADALLGAAGQSIVFSDVVDALAGQLAKAATAAGGVLATQKGGAINPQAGGLASLTPTAVAPGIGTVPANGGALIQSSGINTALASYAGIVSHDAGGVVSNDGGSLFGKSGGGLISQDGAGLISQDGAGVISRDGAGVISNDGGSLISQDGAGLISQDGAGLAASHGSASFVLKNGSSALGGAPAGAAYGSGQPTVRSYTLTADPGTVAAAPPVAAPEQVVSALADGTAIRNTPAVAALSNGKYVTVWIEQKVDSTGYSLVGPPVVRGQVLNADDTPSGAAFTVASPAGGDESAPSVTGLANGRFMVTWTDRHLNQPVDQYNNKNNDVLAQFFNADGTADGAPVTVNTGTYANQDHGVTASLFTGGAVVVFRADVVINGSIYDNYAKLVGQRYAADGTAVGGNFAIGPATAQDEEQPAAAGLQDGSFVVAYSEQAGSNYPNLKGTIFLQRFTAAGVSAGAPVQVNTTTGGLFDKPAVAVLTDGTFVVAWRKEPDVSTSAPGSVYVQRFSAAGATLGSEIVVTSNAKSSFGDVTRPPALTALHDGGYAVAWNNTVTSTTGEASSDMRGQVFSADGTKQGGTFAANPNPANSYNYRYADPAATTLSDGRLVIDATRLSYVTKPSTSQDVRAEIFTATTTPTAPATYGQVLDGPIQGATVFADANGNGVLDAGEATATTDAQGRYRFTAAASGPVVAIGGTDTRTGLALTTALTAPAGSLSVTALSTLVQKVMASGGATLGEALLRVNTALGLPLHTDATAGNAITATLNGATEAPQALLADAVLLNTLTLAKAAGATGDLFGKLAAQVVASGYGTVDPTAAGTLQVLGLSAGTAASIAALAGAQAQLLQAKLGTDDARSLVKDVTAVNTLAQGTLSASVAARAGDSLDSLVQQYTGGNLAAQVDAVQKAQAGTPYGIAYTDTAKSTQGYTNGDAYTGPVSYLQRQFIWGSPDGVAMAATTPSAFLHGNVGDDALSVTAGSNVLDGGLGSNFLTGASGTDGGTDTFFVDGRGGGVTWSTVNNFHHGDAVTIFGFKGGISTNPGFVLDGAVGYQGATLHSELGGAGTGINASFTLAGLSLADAQGKLTLSTGTVGGNDYLYIAYTG